MWHGQFMDERAHRRPWKEERVETHDTTVKKQWGEGSRDKTTTSLVNGLVVMATEMELSTKLTLY